MDVLTWESTVDAEYFMLCSVGLKRNPNGKDLQEM